MPKKYISSGTRLNVAYTYDLLNRVSKLEYASNTSNGLENLNQYTYVSSSLDAVSTSGQISRHLSYVFKGSYTVASSTYNYTYGNSALGDRLTAYRGVGITYDAIGNPLSYYNGTSYTFIWNGRQLATATKGSNSYTFVCNSDGLRVEKTVNGVVHKYYYSGTQLLAEEWGNNLIIFLYDANGLPVGMKYRTTSYASSTFDTYWYERDLQGDVVAIFGDDSTKYATYRYDAWGNHTVTYYNGGGSIVPVMNNPLRYRGYYYDADLGLYYLQTRYYDSNTGRFINADGYISTGTGLLGYNMYAYCNNNPVMYVDSVGNSPGLILGLVVLGAIVVLALTSCSPQEPTEEQIQQAIGAANTAKVDAREDKTGVDIYIDLSDENQRFDRAASSYYFNRLYERQVEEAEADGVPKSNLMDVEHIEMEYNAHSVGYIIPIGPIQDASKEAHANKGDTLWKMIWRGVVSMFQ